MEKPSLKDLLRNPANVVLVLIFFISILVGFLFVVRIFYHSDDDSIVAMKEISDNLTYYVSYDALLPDGNKAPKVALVLNDNKEFNLMILNNNVSGYTGTFIKKDKDVKLYSDKYYASKIINDYKLFSLTYDENNELILSTYLNGINTYKFKKSDAKEIKSLGFNNTSVKVNNLNNYTYEDSDKDTILNGVYCLTSPYNVIKFIDRIGNNLVTPLDINIEQNTSIFNGQFIGRRNINQYYLLQLVIPNVPNEDYSKSNISSLANNIFKTDINYNNFTNIKINGKPYTLENDKYIVSSNNTENINSNYLKRVYNYESYDNKLYIYEYFVGYECSDGTCRYYPFTQINQDEKSYYDFESNSIDIYTILLNNEKLNSFKWTFTLDADGNYYFESLEYI